MRHAYALNRYLTVFMLLFTPFVVLPNSPRSFSNIICPLCHSATMPDRVVNPNSTIYNIRAHPVSRFKFVGDFQ